jgi:hypothetical protein
MSAAVEHAGDSPDNPAGQLLALRARGFRFIDPRDEKGDVVALVGVRAHDDVIDVVRLHGEDHVVASRLPDDADVLAPEKVYWQRTGPAREVLGKMLALPDDRVPDSVTPDGSRASSLTGRPSCR